MDIFTSTKRSEIMSKIRSRRTKPEMRVHGMLKGHRVRHRMWPKMIGHPDIFIEPNVMIFVNGCFWHGCFRHFRMPKSNVRFWSKKISSNKSRQMRDFRSLRRAGYEVRVLWEHQLKGKDIWQKLKLS